MTKLQTVRMTSVPSRVFFIHFFLAYNKRATHLVVCPKINKRELVELNLTKKSIMTFSWMCFYEVIDEPPVVKFLTFIDTLTTTLLIFKKVWLVSFLYFLICLFI